MTLVKDPPEPQRPAVLPDPALASRDHGDTPDRPGPLWSMARHAFGTIAGRRPWPGRAPSLWDRAGVQYGLAVLFVIAAIAATSVLTDSTGRLISFPFYAAVVAGAWLGLGPGILSFFLSSVAAADFWTPARFDLNITNAELPSFMAFVFFALMCLAWSSQRRRTQYSLEATVQQRTADLVRANAALQAEMAEREAAQKERARTERALREAEVELARTLRLATMAELAATIAHEINQPLAAITANGGACLRSLAHDPPMLDNAREAAACIVADGHRAGDVIARIRALFNKEQPREQQLDLNHLIRHVLDLSRGAIERNRVLVRTQLAEPAAPVMADPVQLQQVLVNLVTNALDAMTDITEWPRVLTARSEIDGDSVNVTIEDTGGGLDPEQVSHIFDSFYTTKAGGVGLGLAISRSIIEAHGGSVRAGPGTSHGARIGFTLALAPDRGTSPEVLGWR